MVEEGDTEAIFLKPRENYTRTLISAAFAKEAAMEKDQQWQAIPG